ncbi:hypothetical protein [Paraburkholderia sp. J12]|uniref:hypothetical protein n=1 Tax=Paraburkholderia sp. J12 TaxID=2805432 RepID=UPI002ABE52DF|nr:hypothetical protein [Paraburkholderia sp. J12]
MSWPRRRTRSTERRSTTPGPAPRAARRGGGASRCRRTWLGLAAACVFTLPLGLSALWAPVAHAQTPRYAFAVIANVVTSQADEPAAQRLIDAIGRDPQNAFVVYDGNLKGSSETCSDSLYDRRRTLLEASRPALVFVPGQRDWASCGANGSGAWDPVERLDLLRQTFFSDPSTLGQNPFTLTRESEVSRFRPYRENVRWQLGDTVFVALNVPDGNNHYLNAGGRNGEFEDRVIANGFWLEHAAEYAKRRNARAIVIFIEADPFAEREERSDRFAWLRFGHRPRDGYLEFKRSLVKLADTFRGPVVLVHTADEKLAHGFAIDQPLRNDKGARIANVTRIEVALREPLIQWLQIDADMTRRTPLRVSMRDVPKHLPLLPPTLPPLLPDSSEPGPETPAMPEVSSMPDVTEIPGMPQAPDVEPEAGASAASGTAPAPMPAPQPGVPNPPDASPALQPSVKPMPWNQ